MKQLTHTFKDIQFKIILDKQINDPFIPESLKDLLICNVIHRTDKGSWWVEMKVSPELVDDPNFLDFVCESALGNYKRSL
jgi:hypothetical protein